MPSGRPKKEEIECNPQVEKVLDYWERVEGVPPYDARYFAIRTPSSKSFAFIRMLKPFEKQDHVILYCNKCKVPTRHEARDPIKHGNPEKLEETEYTPRYRCMTCNTTRSWGCYVEIDETKKPIANKSPSKSSTKSNDQPSCPPQPEMEGIIDNLQSGKEAALGLM